MKILADFKTSNLVSRGRMGSGDTWPSWTRSAGMRIIAFIVWMPICIINIVVCMWLSAAQRVHDGQVCRPYSFWVKGRATRDSTTRPTLPLHQAMYPLEQILYINPCYYAALEIIIIGTTTNLTVQYHNTVIQCMQITVIHHTPELLMYIRTTCVLGMGLLTFCHGTS